TPAHITSLFIQLIAEIFSARVSPLHYPQLIDCLIFSVTEVERLVSAAVSTKSMLTAKEKGGKGH
ncbi:hypothetical protein, partial [Paenibacillus sp. N3.4]|uniref:hypothetical protein n=1 Tax=Paenibacillus sp. N3.4 TaxID=2603222 RepID=UPI001C9D3629